jgi:glycosyltransferase involved in cell wall biosynthesis
MKALFVDNDPQIFEEWSVVRARMREYAAAIGELHIVSPAPAGVGEVEEQDLFLYPVSASRVLRIRALTKRAREIIAARGIEVVSAQDPFEQGLAAFRATRGTAAKLHLQVHTDFLSPWFTKFDNPWRLQVKMPLINTLRRSWADQVLPEADGIRVVSGRVKQSLITRYGARIKEPAVIPVRTPRELSSKVPLPTSFHFTFIVVGRLEPEKRVEDILAAFSRIAARYPSIGIAIVGDGRERHALETMVKKHNLGKQVIFLGARADAWGLIQSADAFVQASAYEGYGRTLIEAALACVPIITTDVGIVGEVFKVNDDVLSVSVADPVALARHLVGTIEDAAARTERAQCAELAARTHLAAVKNAPADIAADLAMALD